MNLKKIVTTAAVLSALTMGATTASAEAPALANFNKNYTTTVSDCLLCHTASTGAGGVLNLFGANFKAAGGTKTAYMPNWGTLDGMDADNNGTFNGAQIAAGDAPAGNGTLAAFTVPSSASSTAAPSSGGGCVTSSVTTPLMMVLAMLSLGFFVRRKKTKF
ncbi:MAG: hypothetical protein Q9N62_02235 [Ghiorsea sp.]|nr:hypothetical protein [Ghiorsea sp.]